MSASRELVQVVAIDLPFCTREYGDAFLSPTGSCNAVLGSTGDQKCYNTRKTCQAVPAYNPGTLTLYFGKEGQGALARNYGYVIPSIQSISTTPATINLAGMDEESSALGTREQVTITFRDHQHSDHKVDKYRLQRSTGAAASGSPPRIFNPFTSGTFWGKFLARNPYHQGVAITLYEGYLGDALSAMRARKYIIDRIEGPTDGMVRLVAKDIFSLFDSKKAMAPAISRGRLLDNITTTATLSPAQTVRLTPTGIGDQEYPTAGWVVIGEEIIRVTRSGDILSLQDRAQFGTTAKTHDADDLVQVVLTFASGKAHDHAWTLLCNYTTLGSTGSPTGSTRINKSAWDAQASSNVNLYAAVIAKPTPVIDLVGELALIAGFTLIPNTSTGLIDLVMLRPDTVSPTVTDAKWIQSKPPIKLKRQDTKRVSQVLVYFGQINPTKDLDEETNYHSCYAGGEASSLYGTTPVKQVFSRWTPQFARSSAQETADRIYAMFRDPPLQAEFSLHDDRDGDLSLARYFNLQTASAQDATGAADLVAVTPISIGYDQATINVKAQAVVFGAPTDSATRNIYIDNDCQNINLREIHDGQYDAPIGGSPTLTVNFIISSGVVVGSAFANTPALRTGNWPNGVALTLTNNGRIQGKGGKGASAAQAGSATLDANAAEQGGDAVRAEYPILIDNIHGSIWSGGGGGGAGQTRGDSIPANWSNQIIAGGGPGGGGAGSDPGDAGIIGASNQNFALAPALQGAAATTTAGGTKGTGAGPDPLGENPMRGGDGGDGGGPGLSGSNGSLGSGSTTGGAVSNGALAGYAINGQSYVTWLGSPDGDRGDTRGRFI